MAQAPCDIEHKEHDALSSIPITNVLYSPCYSHFAFTLPVSLLENQYMSTSSTNLPSTRFTGALIAALLAFSSGVAFADGIKVTLRGDKEVPAVTSSATGDGLITVSADKSVTGSIKTTGIVGTAAHIHLGAPGKNGPPIVSLMKTGDDNVWLVPAGAKLTDAQFASFKAGDLYVNVHSDANRNGEIRGQLKP